MGALEQTERAVAARPSGLVQGFKESRHQGQLADIERALDIDMAVTDARVRSAEHMIRGVLHAGALSQQGVAALSENEARLVEVVPTGMDAIARVTAKTAALVEARLAALGESLDGCRRR